MSLDLYYFSGGARERVLEAVIAAGHHVRHVFVNDPQRWKKVNATIQMAEREQIPVTIVKNKSEMLGFLPLVKAKLCLSVGFNYLFAKEFLEAVELCINVHGSLLPKYAGARTLSWAIAHGEQESGVTVHMVDEGIDTGPILLQRAFALSPFETTRSLVRKTCEFEPQVVADALARYERLGRAAFAPQHGQTLPLLPNRLPVHSRIDPNLPLTSLISDIRAADPDYYPAHFFLHGEKVCVRLWRPEKPADEEDLI